MNNINSTDESSRNNNNINDNADINSYHKKIIYVNNININRQHSANLIIDMSDT